MFKEWALWLNSKIGIAPSDPFHLQIAWAIGFAIGMVGWGAFWYFAFKFSKKKEESE